jgi:hypothetical protein
MFLAILDFLILPGSHLTSVSIQKLKFLLVSRLMMPNLGPCGWRQQWLRAWVAQGEVAGGEILTKCCFDQGVMEFWE